MTCQRTSLAVGVLTLASLGLILNSLEKDEKEAHTTACESWKNSIEKTTRLVDTLEFRQWNPLYELAKNNYKFDHEIPPKALKCLDKTEKQMSKIIRSRESTQERDMELNKLKNTILRQCKNPPYPNCSKPHACKKR